MTFPLHLVEPTEDCWRWRGTHRDEYDGRPIWRLRYVYHLVWEVVALQPVPRGLVAHHVCEHHWCVNPAHLTWITQGTHLAEHGLPGDNHQALKTHCPAGHEYTPENTYVWRGERQCRECQRETKRRYRARRRAAGLPPL